MNLFIQINYLRVLYGLVDKSRSNQFTRLSKLPTIKLSPPG